jgi:hypothetical protein
MEYRTAVDESEGDRQSDRRREVAPDYRTLVERICPDASRPHLSTFSRKNRAISYGQVCLLFPGELG